MSVIEIEALLSDIAADTPCGEDLEYDPLFAEMEKLAQETPERQYGDTIIPAEPPDWRGVKKAALSLLERTRDLRVAVYLARALLQSDGFPGFTEGLALVEGLIERYWDGVYPLLDPDDDNDPTLRINTIVALCDSETTLRDLRETPLVSSRAIGRFSLRDVHVATGVLTPVEVADDEELPTQSRLDAAFQDAELEELQATAEAVADARERVERIEAALTDPVVYNIALTVAEAHVLAARDAYRDGETQAAGEMFAHPVSEVLFDMEPVFEARGVADFTDQFLDASAAVFAGESVEEINARTAKIVATLRKASEKAPDDGSSPAAITTGVVADMIDRSTKMYRLSTESDFYEPYLDGYGFYTAAKDQFDSEEEAIAVENPDAAEAIRGALSLLGEAYPTAARPDTLDADVSALTVAASEVFLTVGD